MRVVKLDKLKSVKPSNLPFIKLANIWKQKYAKNNLDWSKTQYGVRVYTIM